MKKDGRKKKLTGKERGKKEEKERKVTMRERERLKCVLMWVVRKKK